MNPSTTTQLQTCDTPILLVDKSSTGKVRPWRKQKHMSRAIAASMYRIYQQHPRKNISYKKRSERMYNCSDYLAFGEHVSQETGEVTKRLDAAWFCRDRLCPMCQWRKSLVTFHQLSAIMDRIDEIQPDAVPIFLTLTMKNVKADDLGSAVTQILRAWGNMVNKATNPKMHALVIGWFRALEITYNSVSQEWHPHIHAIILMPPKYFKDPSLYLDHDAWMKLWRKALRVDYDPSVDVRTIKNDRRDAVAEVSKYAVKPGDWVSDDRCVTDTNVELLATVLKNRRLVGFGQLMMSVRKELKQVDADKADLVHTDDCDTPIRGDLRIALERYDWQAGVTNNYVFTERQEFPVGELIEEV